MPYDPERKREMQREGESALIGFLVSAVFALAVGYVLIKTFL